MEKLALSLGVPVEAVKNALDAMCINMSDYEKSPEDYLPALRSQLGLPGELVIADSTPVPTSIASAKTKAAKGGKLAAKKEAGLAAKSKKGQEAQQVQGNVNSALEVQMHAIAADASTTLDGINAFTNAVGTRIGLEIAGMPMAIGQIAVDVAQEASPEMGVGFSELDTFAARALESIG